MKSIKINDITIRDIFQNIDPGFINEKMLNRVVEQISKVRFDTLEVFGGSAFEKMLGSKFYKNPFEIIYGLKSKNPAIKLQGLIGAKNLVGMEVYSPVIIEKFIKESIKSGISRFRVFDSLNDINNFNRIVSSINNNNGICQGTIIYDDLKENEFYIETAKALKNLGCESICIKDVESTLLPGRTQELFKGLAESIDIPVYLSCYNLRGLQVSNYYNACTNGCAGVDMSFIPSSYNDLSPTIFPFILSFKDMPSSIDLDYLKMLELFEFFKQKIYPMIKNEMLHSSFIFSHKNQNLLPKWLLSNINLQLNEIGESNKIDIVLEEVFKIKNEIGNPSLSTPVGQIIGSQAILNTIISDYRYEITSDELKKLVSGYYGKLPRAADSNVLKKILEEKEPINGSIQDDDTVAGTSRNGKPDYLIDTKLPGMENMIEDRTYEQCLNEIKDLSSKDSDILSYVFFPEKIIDILKIKKTGKTGAINGKTGEVLEKELSFPEFFDSRQQVKFDDIDIKKIREITELVQTSNIDEIKLEIDGVKISINKKPSSPGTKGPKEASLQNLKEASPEEMLSGRTDIEQNIPEELLLVKSPIVGTFYKSSSPQAPPFINIGSKVKKGDTLCIIEAMKLMNKINSEYDGEIVEILSENEEAVEYGQVLIKIRPL